MKVNTLIKMKLYTIAALALAISMAGEANAALIVGGEWSWGHATDDLDIGSDSTQTCFLTGIHGALKGEYYLGYAKFKPARVEVIRTGGRWKIRTRYGAGTGVSAQVRCINTTTNRVAMSWSGDSKYPGWVPLGNATRHCFLTSVWATTGLSTTYTPQRGVSITKTGTDWRINGNMLDGDGYGGGTAYCVDIPTNWYGAGSWFITYGTGPSTGDLSFFGAPDRGCFMTGLVGYWYTAPLFWGDRAHTFLDPKTNRWKITASNGRGLKVECLDTK